MINRNIIRTQHAPCPERIPRTCKYGVGIQLVITGDTPILDAAVYGKDRKLLIRILLEKGNWLVYNNETCKWDKRTIEYILRKDFWYNVDAKQFFVRVKEIAVIRSFFRQIGVKENGIGFGMLVSYVALLRQRRNIKASQDKEAREKALLEKTMQNAPALPEDIEEYIRNNVMVKSRYLFFETKKDKKYGYCTHCLQMVEVPWNSRHKEKGVCPACGSKVIFMAQRYSHKYLKDENTFTIMQSVDDTFYIRTFEARWDFSDYLKVKKDMYLVSISYYNAEEKAYFNFVSGQFKRQCGYSFTSNGVWYYNTSMFHDYGTVYPLADHKLFSGKVYRFMIKQWDKEELNARISFLSYQERVPYIEMMLKNGFIKIAKGIVSCGAKGQIPLNLKGKSITDVFGLPRHEINLIKKHDMDLGAYKLYKRLRTEAGLKCNEEIFDWMDRVPSYCEERFFELMAYTTPQKLWNYFLKQYKRKNIKDMWVFYDFLTTWSDYVKICLYLGYDTKKSIVLYPRRLKAKHDEVAAIQRQLIEAERARKREEAEAARAKEDLENALFVERIAVRLNRQLAYENDNYLIRAAASVQELVDEGNVLDHCVGGYAGRIAEGNTAVLFIRSKSEPDKPLCTVEYLRNYERVGQCSGYDNKLNVQSIKDFIEEWKEIKKIA